jgi:tRNA-dihydrouridine synthase
VNAIDLNLGCPQKIAKKGNYGAYLLPNKKRVLECLKAMVNNLNCPITAKIRCFDSVEETLDMCVAIENVGVKMLTVHGRTVDSLKMFTGPANWDIIRKIKQTLSIPVVANGGIGDIFLIF